MKLQIVKIFGKAIETQFYLVDIEDDNRAVALNKQTFSLLRKNHGINLLMKEGRPKHPAHACHDVLVSDLEQI